MRCAYDLQPNLRPGLEEDRPSECVHSWFCLQKREPLKFVSIIKACGNIRKAKTLEQFLASFLCDISKTPIDSYIQMWCILKALLQRGLGVRGSLLPMSDPGPRRLCTGDSQHLPSVSCEQLCSAHCCPVHGSLLRRRSPGEAALCPTQSPGAVGQDGLCWGWQKGQLRHSKALERRRVWGAGGTLGEATLGCVL